jgi:hypothetical protein
LFFNCIFSFPVSVLQEAILTVQIAKLATEPILIKSSFDHDYCFNELKNNSVSNQSIKQAAVRTLWFF